MRKEIKINQNHIKTFLLSLTILLLLTLVYHDGKNKVYAKSKYFQLNNEIISSFFQPLPILKPLAGFKFLPTLRHLPGLESLPTLEPLPTLARLKPLPSPSTFIPSSTPSLTPSPTPTAAPSSSPSPTVTLSFTPTLTPTPILSAAVVLNEFMPKPSSGSDWIELYNALSVNQDLSLWTLEDTTGVMLTIPFGTTIEGGAVLVFTVGNRLNNTGDTIFLRNEEGDLLDQRLYPPEEVSTDVSIGRQPDGGSFKICNTSSKGATNNTSC